MKATIQDLQDDLINLKLDHAVMYLNHLLSVSRGMTEDQQTQRHLSSLGFPLPPHVVHLLAKQVLLHGSNLGIRELNWEHFRRLLDAVISFDDPVQNDPNWNHTDPSGFFERISAQQIVPQRRNLIQKYGLAMGLFRDVSDVEWPKSYSLRADVECALGISIDQFMSMGHLTYALRRGSYNGHMCLGSFTHSYLAEAFNQGFEICVPEVWEPFLSRVACDRDSFREICNQDLYKVNSPQYTPFEFNPLVRVPIIEVIPNHYLSVDPDLIGERVTFGMFYDLFEQYGPNFVVNFGHVFDRFVGSLLESVCEPDLLWSASAWEQMDGRPKNHGKIGDWAYSGSSHTVLFECKSLRPNLKLSTYGSDESIQEIVDRLSKAIRQLDGHAQSIREGNWITEGLNAGPTVFVVVTYGRINTANGPFLRRRIEKKLAEWNIEFQPFVVLSLEEIDSVIRLVEMGHKLDEVLHSLATEKESFDVLRRYNDELAESCVSSVTIKRGQDFINSIRPNTITGPDEEVV